jgi:hypothetical protein
MSKSNLLFFFLLSVPWLESQAISFFGENNFDEATYAGFASIYRVLGSDTENGEWSLENQRLEFTKGEGEGSRFLLWDGLPELQGSRSVESFETDWLMRVRVSNIHAVATDDNNIIGIEVAGGPGIFYSVALASLVDGWNVGVTRPGGFNSRSVPKGEDITLLIRWDAASRELHAGYSLTGSLTDAFFFDTFLPAGQFGTFETDGFWFELFAWSTNADVVVSGTMVADDFSVEALPLSLRDPLLFSIDNIESLDPSTNYTRASFQGELGRVYRILSSPDLLSWEPVGSGFAGTGELQIRDLQWSADQPSLFFKAQEMIGVEPVREVIHLPADMTFFTGTLYRMTSGDVSVSVTKPRPFEDQLTLVLGGGGSLSTAVISPPPPSPGEESLLLLPFEDGTVSPYAYRVINTPYGVLMEIHKSDNTGAFKSVFTTSIPDLSGEAFVQVVRKVQALRRLESDEQDSISELEQEIRDTVESLTEQGIGGAIIGGIKDAKEWLSNVQESVSEGIAEAKEWASSTGDEISDTIRGFRDNLSEIDFNWGSGDLEESSEPLQQTAGEKAYEDYRTNENPFLRIVDCNGVENGTAFIDWAGRCVGGNTGIKPTPPSLTLKGHTPMAGEKYYVELHGEQSQVDIRTYIADIYDEVLRLDGAEILFTIEGGQAEFVHADSDQQVQLIDRTNQYGQYHAFLQSSLGTNNVVDVAALVLTAPGYAGLLPDRGVDELAGALSWQFEFVDIPSPQDLAGKWELVEYWDYESFKLKEKLRFDVIVRTFYNERLQRDVESVVFLLKERDYYFPDGSFNLTQLYDSPSEVQVSGVSNGTEPLIQNPNLNRPTLRMAGNFSFYVDTPNGQFDRFNTAPELNRSSSSPDGYYYLQRIE